MSTAMRSGINSLARRTASKPFEALLTIWMFGLSRTKVDTSARKAAKSSTTRMFAVRTVFGLNVCRGIYDMLYPL